MNTIVDKKGSMLLKNLISEHEVYLYWSEENSLFHLFWPRATSGQMLELNLARPYVPPSLPRLERWLLLSLLQAELVCFWYTMLPSAALMHMTHIKHGYRQLWLLPSGGDRSSLVQVHRPHSLGSQTHTYSSIISVPGMIRSLKNHTQPLSPGLCDYWHGPSVHAAPLLGSRALMPTS